MAESSRAYTVALDGGVHGRLWASMGPEWRVGLNNAETFARVVLALRFASKTSLAVNVAGKIKIVMCFYDPEHRPYDSQCVDIVMRLVWAVRSQLLRFTKCSASEFKHPQRMFRQVLN